MILKVVYKLRHLASRTFKWRQLDDMGTLGDSSAQIPPTELQTIFCRSQQRSLQHQRGTQCIFRRSETLYKHSCDGVKYWNRTRAPAKRNVPDWIEQVVWHQAGCLIALVQWYWLTKNVLISWHRLQRSARYFKRFNRGSVAAFEVWKHCESDLISS